MFGLDFGEEFLKMIEESRGKKAADKLLGALVVGVYCVVALAVLGVLAALWAIMKEAIFLFGGLETPSIATVSAFTIALLSIVMATGGAIVLRLLRRTAVSQAALNELAKIREDGINKLYADTPANEADMPRWEREYRQWEKKVKKHLGANFPSADFSRFSNLGVILAVRFEPTLIVNSHHEKLMRFFVKQLDTLEEILACYRGR